MTRTRTLACVLVAGGLLTGCKVGTDPFAALSVSGSITEAGEPATARIELTAGNFRTVRDYDGSYVISVSGGGVPESDCDDVAISAGLLASDGETVLDEEVRTLDGCGDHTVDFTFP